MKKEAADSLAVFRATVGTIAVSLLGWIGYNVSFIPVIQEQVKQVVDRTTDHESRIRMLETRR